ncbi:Serine proteinase stubble [Nymphon striatum]|nr:Serine proteinase stubble [Nymphon striatum]
MADNGREASKCRKVSMKIRLGEYDASKVTERLPHYEYTVSKIIVNPHWNPANFQNDLALLKLSTRIQFREHIIPVCLPTQGEVFTNDSAVITGWGRIKHGVPTRTHILQEATVKVVANENCQKWFKEAGRSEKIYNNEMICAGYKNGGVDACQVTIKFGDSGGPLTLNKNGLHTLIGLVSWGVGCGKANLPGIYTNIANYVTWISNTESKGRQVRALRSEGAAAAIPHEMLSRKKKWILLIY